MSDENLHHDTGEKYIKKSSNWKLTLTRIGIIIIIVILLGIIASWGGTR